MTMRHPKLESTVQYMGVEVDDAPALPERIEVGWLSPGGVDFRWQLYEWTFRLCVRGSVLDIRLSV